MDNIDVSKIRLRQIRYSILSTSALGMRDKQDAEPLHWAALQGHAAVVEEWRGLASSADQ
jgi:ankyrin repeat protein